MRILLLSCLLFDVQPLPVATGTAATAPVFRDEIVVTATGDEHPADEWRLRRGRQA